MGRVGWLVGSRGLSSFDISVEGPAKCQSHLVGLLVPTRPALITVFFPPTQSRVYTFAKRASGLTKKYCLMASN